MSLIYDNRFDALTIERSEEVFIKEKLIDVIALGMQCDEYVTLADLEQRFSISSYHIKKYISHLGVKPFGEIINIVNGKRSRGIGKYAYRSTIVKDIEDLLAINYPIETHLEEARKILES